MSALTKSNQSESLQVRHDIPAGAWRWFAVYNAVGFVLQLDGTLITVALPSVAHDLRVSSGSSATLLSVYFAAYALLLLPGGMLVDRFGVRRVALVGLLVFLTGASLGAVAGNFEMLIAARSLQGVGAGLVSPAALAGAVSGFPPQRRGAALGVWGASAGVANLTGPLIGGTLIELFGWRADWWALVPLGVVAFAAVLVPLPPSEHNEPSSCRRAPINRHVLTAALIGAVTFAVMIGSFCLLEQYLQDSAHFSALPASAALALVALSVALTAPVAGRLADVRGDRFTALLGFSVAGFGLAVLGMPGTPLSGGIGFALLGLFGVGLGMLFAPTSRAGLNSAAESAHGRASALLSIGRLLGAMIGASAAGVALSGGPSAAGAHHALLVACACCVLLGLPATWSLQRRPQPSS